MTAPWNRYFFDKTTPFFSKSNPCPNSLCKICRPGKKRETTPFQPLQVLTAHEGSI